MTQDWPQPPCHQEIHLCPRPDSGLELRGQTRSVPGPQESLSGRESVADVVIALSINPQLSLYPWVDGVMSQVPRNLLSLVTGSHFLCVHVGRPEMLGVNFLRSCLQPMRDGYWWIHTSSCSPPPLLGWANLEGFSTLFPRVTQDGATGLHSNKLMNTPFTSWLPSLTFLTSPLPHSAFWDHLCNKLLGPNSLSQGRPVKEDKAT